VKVGLRALSEAAVAGVKADARSWLNQPYANADWGAVEEVALQGALSSLHGEFLGLATAGIHSATGFATRGILRSIDNRFAAALLDHGNKRLESCCYE